VAGVKEDIEQLVSDECFDINNNLYIGYEMNPLEMLGMGTKL
jgi:hypothetical protein